jgi:hypothetical protein
MTAILVMKSSIPPKFVKREDRRAVQNIKVKIRCRLQDLLDVQGLTRSALGQALQSGGCVKTHLKDMTLIRWRCYVIFLGVIWAICLKFYLRVFIKRRSLCPGKTWRSSFVIYIVQPLTAFVNPR